MDKDSLNQINRIELEIKKIDSFLANYYKAPRSIKLAVFKQKFMFALQVKGYGFLPQMEYRLPYGLNDEILKVVRAYREKLVADQEKLWGKE